MLPQLDTPSPNIEHLAGVYWRQLFEFARRLGQSHHDAEDTVQDVFTQLLSSRHRPPGADPACPCL